MRENYAYGSSRYIRLLVVSLFTLVSAVSLLAFLASTAKADPLDVGDPAAAEQPLAPEPVQYEPGMPHSTTAVDIKQTGAKLTWTPTGVATVQDNYEVLLTRTPDVDLTSGRLTGETALPGQQLSLLTIAELDVSALSEGTYYWQVSSCAIGTPCITWSDVQTVNIDATAPSIPIAAVTSGTYDRTVVMSGGAEAGGTISVTVDDTTCEAVVGGDGMWNCEFAAAFEYGDYTALVKAVDRVGNESPPLEMVFSVKELFVAVQIVTEELPAVLEIIPVNENPENTVLKQPISALDTSIGDAETKQANDLNSVLPLSTDGGIVQSSEDGWQVLGMPWFVWFGGLSGAAAGWWALGGVVPRRLASLAG